MQSGATNGKTLYRAAKKRVKLSQIFSIVRSVFHVADPREQIIRVISFVQTTNTNGGLYHPAILTCLNIHGDYLPPRPITLP